MSDESWILILDDDPAMARCIARELKVLAEPRYAATCGAARAALADRRGLLAVVLDLELGDGRGLDVLAELRQHDAHVPVLMLSGTGDREPVNDAQRLGAEFAYKPFVAANLRAFADRVLQKRLVAAFRRWVLSPA
ncbi:MAG: response regulator [Polyangiaceae bacterium]|nr:response regulator [Polyangiaceae bacterium]